MRTRIKVPLIIIFFLNLNCSDVNNISESVKYLQNGSYILKQSVGASTIQQELSINSNTFHFFNKHSDGTTDLDFLTFAGTYSYEQSVLYMQIETGYDKITIHDSIFVNIPTVPEIKAVLIDFSFDTLKMYGGAIVFRRDSSYNRSVWGKWKSNYTLGSGITANPVGKIYENNDSLTYLRLSNDSTWSFQSFGALSQTIVSTGKIKQIIEIKEATPCDLKDSMLVYDSKNDRILAFWELKQPDIMVKTH